MVKNIYGELSERDQSILDAIVYEYINSPEPVGSRTISQKLSHSLSSATIRNVASELEELGYLFQPHHSSGRIPTDRGFRLYVDRLMDLRQLTDSQKNRIEENYNINEMSLNQLLEETSKVLSTISHNVGLVLSPKLSVSKFEHIEFVRISRDNLLVVFVTKSGVVYNKRVKMTEPLCRDDLQRVSNYLNSIMKDLNLIEIRRKILQELQNAKIAYDQHFMSALNILKGIVDKEDYHSELFIEGASNIINDPIFKNVVDIKNILKAFEDKKLLIDILDKAILADSPMTFIGEENNQAELSNCSVITSNYKRDGSVLGALGVIGPRRMNYSRIIPLVDYMSKLVSRMLEIIA